MRRFATVAVLVAAVCGVLGVVTPAAGASCVDETYAYAYCGDHWRFSKLPVQFRVNVTSAPGSLSDNGIMSAARGAIFEWDRHWPGNRTSINNNGITKQPGDCGYVVVHALCYAGTTENRLDTSDGVNSILWAPPTDCNPGLPADAVAVACLAYENTSASPWVLPDSGGKRIREVDILLNPAKTWRIPSPHEVLLGEAIGAMPFTEGTVSDFVTNMFWFDVQGVLAHEVGHAIGLEHVGLASPWPDNFEDSARYTQTMYRWYYRGSTNKRTLDTGDILGLQRVALESMND